MADDSKSDTDRTDTDRSDYDTPKVPPATPPVIDPDVDPIDARELAQDDGDSDHDGSTLAGEKKAAERTALNERLAKRDARDGMGEQGMDATSPETLLPPD